MFAAITIDLDPNLVQLGPLTITWHGIFSVLGIIAAARIAQWLLARDGLTGEQVYDMALWMVVAGLVGARLLYVWENYQLFASAPPYKVLMLNEGGISQWGGIFGALVGAYAWCRRHRVSYLLILDAAGPANAVGFFVGRIGDVINGEHHAIATSLPWGVEYVNAHTLGQPGRVVHPEVAYEMVLSLLLLLILLPLYSRMKAIAPDGVTGLVWLALYALGRTLLSFLREDSLFFGLRQAQWAGIVMVAVAAVMIPLLWWRARRAEPRAPAPPVRA